MPETPRANAPELIEAVDRILHRVSWTSKPCRVHSLVRRAAKRHGGKVIDFGFTTSGLSVSIESSTGKLAYCKSFQLVPALAIAAE